MKQGSKVIQSFHVNSIKGKQQSECRGKFHVNNSGEVKHCSERCQGSNFNSS